MSDSQETSYYEIALTHGQVGVTFVIFLGALIVAFLTGIWVGKGRSPEAPPEITPPTVAEATEPELEEFKFFSEDGASQNKADGGQEQLTQLLREPDPKSTLAEDLGVQEALPKQEPPKDVPVVSSRPVEKPAVREEQRPAPKASQESPTRVVENAPAQSAGSSPAGGDDWVIQVLSTGEKAKAEQLLARLKAGGFSAFLSPAEMQGQAMYRVRVGPFAERDVAERVADTVKRRYRVDTWITH